MNDWSRRDYPTPNSSLSPPVIKTEDRSPPSDPNSHLESPSLPRLDLVRSSDESHSVEKKRITPCEQCRKVRRACKWREGEARKRCERCTTAGIACSGPTRRTKSTKTTTSLESSSSPTTVAVLSSSRKQSRTREASIGPSSPESRWSTLHMSYSLMYHLVETGASCLDQAYYTPAFDYDAFVARLNDSKGRIETLDSVDLLLALCQAVVGTYYSVHTALLRLQDPLINLERLLEEPVEVFKIREIGMARREPFIAIARNLAEQARQPLFDPETPKMAVEQVSIWYFAIDTISGIADFESERLLLIRNLVKQGFDYLAQSVNHGPDHDGFAPAFSEIVLEEISLSLLHDFSTTISPSQYRSLFGDQTPIAFPTLPSDISFVFSTPPEPPDVRNIAFDFQRQWHILPRSLYRHLESVLAFSPKSKLLAAIGYCWNQVSKLLDLFRRAIGAILSDPRYTPTDLRLRPKACLTNLVFGEANSMVILRSCHNMLDRLPRSAKLLAKSEQFWFEALSRSTMRLRLVPICRRSNFDIISSSCQFVNCLRLCPPHTLFRWANSFPKQCKELIKVLRIATFGLPEACRFVHLLESANPTLV